MIDNAFRAQLPRFTAPLIALYQRLHWTPNHVTALGFAIALLASAAVASGHLWVAFGLWWVSRLADGTDGLLARETGQESDFGAYFDIVLDMAAYGAMVLGFAAYFPAYVWHWMAMLFLYILCIASALALGMQEAKREMEPRDDRGLRLGAGLAEGGETGIAYSLFLLFPGALGVLATIWVIVLATTVIARTALAYRGLSPSASPEAPPPPPPPSPGASAPPQTVE
ncbi:MAG: CDP-alcohol phosphatidyltransferase family protein [Myxococcota bacterium]